MQRNNDWEANSQLALWVEVASTLINDLKHIASDTEENRQELAKEAIANAFERIDAHVS
tara:strand:+ start:891 stop:1067 length:177 start_codon:yes stop_codon:yes gene_type:complete